jgi:hypothetical protein
MTPPITAPTYLHGFSDTEQHRLVTQSRLFESSIFSGIDYGGATRLLEVGSGVGAQTDILLRRFPEQDAVVPRALHAAAGRCRQPAVRRA